MDNVYINIFNEQFNSITFYDLLGIKREIVIDEYSILVRGINKYPFLNIRNGYISIYFYENIPEDINNVVYTNMKNCTTLNRITNCFYRSVDQIEYEVNRVISYFKEEENCS